MTVIDHLLQEHRDIMAQVADIRRASAELSAQGEAALPETTPVLARFGQMMATQLARHARKEDEILFPAIEAAIGAGGGPTEIMRQEHKAIHWQGELLRRTLYELNEVEHPRIETGGARLRDLIIDDPEAEALRTTADEIIRLLDMHFAKEEQILFPMALLVLESCALDALEQKMAALA